MLGIVKEINGEKTIIPLTTDAGTGAPVGTLIQQYKKKPMSGYLYCDGSTFDENAYPALYMYLGSNVLPDYRECVMVGAEQNTTDTIATHDVYGEGEFKDDQFQNHTHTLNAQDIRVSETGTAMYGSIYKSSFTTDGASGRAYNTTHGKQKAVYVYIKATSGLAENQQDNVLNNVKGYVDTKIGSIVHSGNSTYNFEDYYKATSRTHYSGLIVFIRVFTESSNGAYILNLCEDVSYYLIGGHDVSSFTFDVNTCELNITTKPEYGRLASFWFTILG